MTTPTGAQCPNANVEHLQAAFLAIMPKIKTHAEVYFRFLKCPGKKDDAVAEVVAVAWKWYLRLSEQGKDVTLFVSALARLAARHVRHVAPARLPLAHTVRPLRARPVARAVPIAVRVGAHAATSRTTFRP